MPINYHSKIISYLVDVCGEKTNIDTIVNTMKSLNVKCKFKDSLIIFNYERDADFSNPIVQESRGIIMDMGPISIYKDIDFNNWKIVAFPFRKFGNFNESYADKITWETAQIQEKLDGCFTRRDTVLLADGTAKSIAEIVNNEEQIEVLSYNFKTKKIEPKKVIGWKKGADLESPEHFLTIHTKKIKNTLKGKISQHHIITPTKNHVFFVKKEGKIIEVCADELQVGDILLTPTKGLTEIEKQVVLGGWLGDGSIINKNSGTQGFCAIHSQKQKEYVDFKTSLFSSIKVKRKDYIMEHSYGKEKSRMDTSCSQGFTDLYNLCYKDGKKKVSNEWLEQLNWLGFAIWYMDDGSLNTSNKNNSIHLHTEGFSFEENQIIAEFFNQKGFKTYIRNYRDYNMINFSSQASEQIWREIRKYIIPSMQYKLPERHQGFFDNSIYNLAKEQSSKIELTTGIIKKIENGLHRKEIPGKTSKYDIEVEDNHNYFCNGILVHNSIMKLYRYQDKWNWATNSCISAEDATTSTGRSFMDVIKSADNFKEINYDILSKHKTYIFELVSPENKVVVEYPIAHLYHIGTRSNLTGIEFNTDIGIQKPKVYDITSPDLNKVLEAANKLNGNGICENEGFVVCDSNFNRVKIKNSQYLLLHHSLTNNFLPKREAIEAIVYNDEEKIAAIQMNPILNVQFKFYDWQFTKFLYELDIYIKSSRSLYQSLQQSRKDFALKIKNDKFNSFGFISIDNPDLNIIQIIKKFGINKILKYIKDYRSL